jgi:hypothetical protein
MTLFFSFSIEYYLPLRGFILIVRIDDLRDSSLNFVRTMLQAWDVFVLFLCIVVTSSILGIVLFRDSLVSGSEAGQLLAANQIAHGSPFADFSSSYLSYTSSVLDGTVNEPAPGLVPSFKDFYNAVTTMFIFICTGENYGKLIYPALNTNPLYLLYFFTMCLVGMFFVLGMVLGQFEESFQTLKEQNQQKQLVFSRIGYISSFILLDIHMQDVITRKEFEQFVYLLVPHLEIQKRPVLNLMMNMNKNSAESTIDIGEFVHALEDLAITHRTYTREDTPSSASASKPTIATATATLTSALTLPTPDFSDNTPLIKSWRQLLEELYEKNEWFRSFDTCVIIFLCFAVCLYGTFPNENILDLVLMIAFVLNTLFICFKVVAYSLIKYWNFAYYFLDEKEISVLVKTEQQAQQQQHQHQHHHHQQQQQGSSSSSSYSPNHPRIRRLSHAALASSSSSSSSNVGGQILAQQHKRSRRRARYDMFEHRFELVVTLGSVLGLMFVLSLDGFSSADRIRFMMAIPVLRMFVIFRRVRHLTYAFFRSLPTIFPMLQFMALIFIAYGVVGVALFSGKFDRLQVRLALYPYLCLFVFCSVYVWFRVSCVLFFCSPLPHSFSAVFC